LLLCTAGLGVKVAEHRMLRTMVSFFVHSFPTLQFSSFYIRYFITVNIYIIFLFVSVGMLSYCQTITV